MYFLKLIENIQYSRAATMDQSFKLCHTDDEKRTVVIYHDGEYATVSRMFAFAGSSARAAKFWGEKGRAIYFAQVAAYLGTDPMRRHKKEYAYHILLIKFLLAHLDMVECAPIFAAEMKCENGELPMMPSHNFDEWRIIINDPPQIARITRRRHDGWIKLSTIYADKLYDGSARTTSNTIKNRIPFMRRLHLRESSNLPDDATLTAKYTEVIGREWWSHPTLFITIAAKESVELCAAFTEVIMGSLFGATSIDHTTQPRFKKDITYRDA
jgi:hypothetical protein